MDATRPADEPVFLFGPFELYPARRLLVKDGVTVKIGGRAFDLLIILAENTGRIAANQELIARVWGKLIVVDTNIRVHVASLRRVLGDDRRDTRYIVHVARRGYIFVAPRSGISGVAGTDVGLGSALPGSWQPGQLGSEAVAAARSVKPPLRRGASLNPVGKNALAHPGPRPLPSLTTRFDRNGSCD
jgi:DNA-binding winged helix-turn-helix (wHTH) protein